MKYNGIEIEGLPEGWEPVAARIPTPEDYVLKSHCRVNHWAQLSDEQRSSPQVILIKKPERRRGILEETDEPNTFITGDSDPGVRCYKKQRLSDQIILIETPRIWRVVEDK